MSQTAIAPELPTSSPCFLQMNAPKGLTLASTTECFVDAPANRHLLSRAICAKTEKHRKISTKFITTKAAPAGKLTRLLRRSRAMVFALKSKKEQQRNAAPGLLLGTSFLELFWQLALRSIYFFREVWYGVVCIVWYIWYHT